MPRLHLTVEGQTEQAFAASLLIPHLADKGVYLSKPQLAAHAKKKGMSIGADCGGTCRFRTTLSGD